MILLDTHALVWAAAEPKRLSRAAAWAIRRARGEDGVAVSVITLWELAALVARGRIRAWGTVEATVHLLLEGVTIKPLTEEIAALATEFSDDYSHDPADRLIGATARAEALPLVARDERIRRCPLLKTVW